MTKRYFFVAGTDTEVGKTFATCALLKAAAARGLSTVGLKPLAAGCQLIEGEWRNEDALLLQQHMTCKLLYSQVNPVALQTATSPHIAAALEQRMVSVSRLLGFCRGALLERPDFALIEGVGGWRAPINDLETMADLAKQLEFKVLLVVGLRLGCLSHAALTAEAIRHDGLELAGWIANQISPEPMSYAQENITKLSSMLGVPMIGHLPYSQTKNPTALCKQLDLDCLDL